MNAEIIATGAYVPEKTVTNDDLAKVMDTNDEWIRTRTGIMERRIAESGEGSVISSDSEKSLRLACIASERALDEAEKRASEGRGAAFTKRGDIELVIVATSTPDMSFPATACRLQDELSLEGAAAFDLSLACTGFIAALSTANAYIKAGVYRNILVVGVDVLSRLIDWGDRSTAVLFGDAAGAAVVSASESGSGIMNTVLHSDGAGGSALYCKSMYFNETERSGIKMDGKRVYEFAVRKVPEVIRECLAGKDEEEIKYFVLHQANIRIIEAAARRLKQEMDKFPHNIELYGNTTAASIPLLLDELSKSGKIEKGDELCLAGFGAGLSYGAILLKW